jgi:hypothetical protein
MKCKDQIKLTPEEEKLLNESVYKILCEGLDIVRRRFPNLNDFSVKEPDPRPANQNPQPNSTK